MFHFILEHLTNAIAGIIGLLLLVGYLMISVPRKDLVSGTLAALNPINWFNLIKKWWALFFDSYTSWFYLGTLFAYWQRQQKREVRRHRAERAKRRKQGNFFLAERGLVCAFPRGRHNGRVHGCIKIAALPLTAADILPSVGRCAYLGIKKLFYRQKVFYN